MKFKDKIFSFLLLVTAHTCQGADSYRETMLGAVGGGNYSYYWFPQPGTVILQLSTIEGDADLYVSSKNLKPTFELENHDLQSTTCGPELIRVPSTYPRPVSIAVYGHPSHDLSLYELRIEIFDSSFEFEETYDHMNSEEIKIPHFNKPSSIPNLPVKDDSEMDNKSMFWTLVLHVLQVLIDLLVD